MSSRYQAHHHGCGYVRAEDVIKIGPINHNDPSVRREALEYSRMNGIKVQSTEEGPHDNNPWPPSPLPREAIRRAFAKV